MRESYAWYNTEADMDAYLAESFDLDRLRPDLADPKSHYFLATRYGVVIGYAKLRHPRRKPRQLAHRRAIELERIYVRASAQGLGAGRRLLDGCVAAARQLDYETLYLGVWEKNPGAAAFYRYVGFQRFGWHYFWFGADRQRDFWMKLDL